MDWQIIISLTGLTSFLLTLIFLWRIVGKEIRNPHSSTKRDFVHLIFAGLVFFTCASINNTYLNPKEVISAERAAEMEQYCCEHFNELKNQCAYILEE